MVLAELTLLDGTRVVSLERLAELRRRPIREMRKLEQQGQLKLAAVQSNPCVRYYDPADPFTDPQPAA